MANEKNLISLADRTTSEQREIAKMGGVASGESRRLNKKLREWLQEDLNSLALDANGKPITDKQGQVYTQARVMSRKYLKNVQKKLEAGETKEYESMLELVEGKTVNVGGSDSETPIRIEQKAPRLTPDQVFELVRNENADPHKG